MGILKLLKFLLIAVAIMVLGVIIVPFVLKAAKWLEQQAYAAMEKMKAAETYRVTTGLPTTTDIKFQKEESYYNQKILYT